jgi:hypothetical protein
MSCLPTTLAGIVQEALDVSRGAARDVNGVGEWSREARMTA